LHLKNNLFGSFCFAETLEVDDFTFAEEFDHITNVRVIHKPQNVVVGYSRLLFPCESGKDK